jgi:hypothetical protein
VTGAGGLPLLLSLILLKAAWLMPGKDVKKLLLYMFSQFACVM